MRTVSDRRTIEQLPDFFGPKELGQCLGIHSSRAYELAKSKGFPSVQLGRKYIIPKAGFLKWLDARTKID